MHKSDLERVEGRLLGVSTTGPSNVYNCCPGAQRGTRALHRRWAIVPQYIEQFRIILSSFKAYGPTIQHYCMPMLCTCTNQGHCSITKATSADATSHEPPLTSHEPPGYNPGPSSSLVLPFIFFLNYPSSIYRLYVETLSFSPTRLSVV